MPQARTKVNFLFERANILSRKPARKTGSKIKKKPAFWDKPWHKWVKISHFLRQRWKHQSQYDLSTFVLRDAFFLWLVSQRWKNHCKLQETCYNLELQFEMVLKKSLQLLQKVEPSSALCNQCKSKMVARQVAKGCATRCNLPAIRLRLHGAIYRPDSFVLMLRYCTNLEAIRYEPTTLNRIVADKSHRVIAA